MGEGVARGLRRLPKGPWRPSAVIRCRRPRTPDGCGCAGDCGSRRVRCVVQVPGRLPHRDAGGRLGRGALWTRCLHSPPAVPPKCHIRRSRICRVAPPRRIRRRSGYPVTDNDVVIGDRVFGRFTDTYP